MEAKSMKFFRKMVPFFRPTLLESIILCSLLLTGLWFRKSPHLVLESLSAFSSFSAGVLSVGWFINNWINMKHTLRTPIYIRLSAAIKLPLPPRFNIYVIYGNAKTAKGMLQAESKFLLILRRQAEMEIPQTGQVLAVQARWWTFNVDSWPYFVIKGRDLEPAEISSLRNQLATRGSQLRRAGGTRWVDSQSEPPPDTDSAA